MRTERVFLMELFLDDELPKAMKVKIKDRFQELEEVSIPQTPYQRPTQAQFQGNQASDPNLANQSPSMQRLMANNPDLIPKVAPPVTPAAAQALAARQALINSAGQEKPESGRRGPRKI